MEDNLSSRRTLCIPEEKYKISRSHVPQYSIKICINLLRRYLGISTNLTKQKDFPLIWVFRFRIFSYLVLWNSKNMNTFLRESR
jgi:hypothetical protein